MALGAGGGSTVSFTVVAHDRASSVFRSIGGALGGMAKLGGAALLGIGAAAGTAAVAATALGVKTAASMEQAQIAFTTMLGSAQKADAFIRQMKDFAAKTPFEFGDLQTAASQLIAVGINSNKVIPIMTTLGNVTSGMGTGAEGVKRATVAIQQMTAAQRISAEDLNQLRDAGIPVYQLLAAALKKPQAEVAKLVQQGKLGKDALDAMMKALETGKGLERFSGLMDKQSRSLSGLWSTIKDTFSQGMADAIQPLLPMLKDVMNWVGTKLPGAFKALSGGIKDIVGGYQGKGTDTFWSKFGEGARKAWDAIKAIGAGIKDIVQGFSGNADNGSFWTKLGEGARDVYDAIKAVTDWIRGDFIPAIQETYQKFKPAFDAIRDAMDKLFGDAKPGADSMKKSFSGLGPTIKAVGDIITKVVIPATGALILAFTTVMTMITVPLSAAFRAIGTITNTVVLPAFRAMSSVFLTVIGAIIEGAARAFGWVPGLGPKLQTAAREFSAFRDRVNAALNGIQ